jgi:hypothetical protein
MKRSLVAVACLLTFGALVSAQSLVEVAKKEKQRRKKVATEENHSYSEQDLKSNGLRTAPPASPTKQGEANGGDDTAVAGPGDPNATSAQQDPTQTEAYWHDKVSAIDKKIQDLETRLKSPAMTANTRGAADREKAEKDLAQAHAERDSLVDEARRKGVPPGWLR